VSISFGGVISGEESGEEWLPLPMLGEVTRLGGVLVGGVIVGWDC
jgi:hypothetical protein